VHLVYIQVFYVAKVGVRVSKTLLIVDDDQYILSTLDRNFGVEGYRVVTALSGQEALGRLAGVDLVVLDLNLGDMDGVEVCRSVRSVSDIPVLMLTARDGVNDRVEGLDAGADDYLVKPFATEELLARVRALLRRHAGEQSPILQVADLLLDRENWVALRGERCLEFTVREYDLLAYLASHAGKVCTRVAIMSAVWGNDIEVGPNTLEVYVGYLRKKLEAGGERRILHTVRGVGYVLRE